MVTELLTIMQDEDIRKALGMRLKELRKQKGWTQKELEGFDSGDQEAIITMIDAMIVKRRVEGAVAPFKQQQASG